MTVSDALTAIGIQRVIPVLRCRDVTDAVATGLACAEAGMRVVELTRTTPDVATAIAALAQAGVVVGLGTVDDPEQVAPAVEAGATFVVSFGALRGLCAAARDAGVTAIPGAMTPTEALDCRREGADAVKLFPADVLRPRFLHHLHTVMPHGRPESCGRVRVFLNSIGGSSC
jgi:2-dehydro-3-deoxyphosphogluconate aldolase/(4S)-4-hydroxy-2-oxoglutarate aldolase